jgi:MoxR-like ATPase
VEDLSQIVGYDDVKRIIVMALRSRKPVHVLPVGPPGIGKSYSLTL